MAKKAEVKEQAKSKHTAVKVGAILLALLAVAYAVVSIVLGTYNPVKWVKHRQAAGQEGEKVVAVSDTGEAMYAGCTYAMPESLAFVSAQSEEAAGYYGEIVITAALDNEYIANTEYDWYIDWTKTISESFADNNKVDDCLEVSVYQGETGKAHIKALKPFGDPIALTVKLKSAVLTITKECKIDFIQIITLADSRGGQSDSFYDEARGESGSSVRCECTFEYSEGTIRGDIALNYLNASPNFYFIGLMKRYVTFDFDYCDYVIPAAESEDQKGYTIEFDQLKTKCRINMTSKTFELSDVLQDYDKSNDKQVEALYYAWYNAFLCEDNEEPDGGGIITNMYWETTFAYSYNGVELDYFGDGWSEEFGCLNAMNMTPDIILSNEYVIL